MSLFLPAWAHGCHAWTVPPAPIRRMPQHLHLRWTDVAPCQIALAASTLRWCSRAYRLAQARSAGLRGDVNVQVVANAKVIFCILARGSSSKDAWPKSPEGVRELGNTRDDVARSLMAAFSSENAEAGAVLVFEDTPQTRSRHWWVLTREFLQNQEPTEYLVLRQCQQLAQAVYHEQSASRPPGAGLLQSRDCKSAEASLQSTAEALFEALGDPEHSVLVLLDETFPALPVTAPVTSDTTLDARRAVFVLGLREELNAEQLECFARAAVKKHWSVLRLSLGWVGEFTSKVVARLQALHSCRQLLPSLGILKEDAYGEHWKESRLGWPCPSSRDGELFNRDGPLVHFFLPVKANLTELSCEPTSSRAAACSLIARSCIAGLWRAHHAWDRCRLSFAFADGAVVTVTRRFKGRFQRKRATEYYILRELRELVDAALAEPRLGKRAKAATPGRRACTVQLPQGGRLPTLPYRRDGTLQLCLQASEPPSSSAPCSKAFASELLQELWKPRKGKDAPSCMVCLVFIASSPPPISFAAGWQGIASLRLPYTDHFTVLCTLQSALLGERGSGAELLAELLVPIAPFSRTPSRWPPALFTLRRCLGALRDLFLRGKRTCCHKHQCLCCCFWRHFSGIPPQR